MYFITYAVCINVQWLFHIDCKAFSPPANEDVSKSVSGFELVTCLTRERKWTEKVEAYQKNRFQRVTECSAVERTVLQENFRELSRE